MQYFYSNITQEDGRSFAQVKATNIKRLPIPDSDVAFEQQQSLAQKAEQMIELNKQLHEGIDSALELIKS